MALYYPGLGYYTSEKEKTGRRGDYYTAADISSIFAMMIARQLEEMYNLLNKRPFTIVEYGAGSGFLCSDILTHLQNNKRMFDNLRMKDMDPKFMILTQTKNVPDSELTGMKLTSNR